MDNSIRENQGGQFYLKQTENEDTLKMVSIIESLLFAYGDPISKKDLIEYLQSKNFSIKTSEFTNLINILIKKYESLESGIELIILEDRYQLSTKGANYEYINDFLNPIKRKSLTQASLETLAIIAYNQPVTKPEIESIRGVKCDKPISTLIEIGLIQEAGRLDKIGKPIIYKTSEKFLEHFSISSIKDLPPLQDFFEESLSDQ